MSYGEVCGERVKAVREEEEKEFYKQEALVAAGGSCLAWLPPQSPFTYLIPPLSFAPSRGHPAEHWA